MFKKISLIMLIAVTFSVLFTGCSTNISPDEQLSMPKKGDQIAIMETSMGTIKLKFFPQYAPKAVENFITHAKNGYYNGVIFHRVINNFMIQSGDPTGTGSGGESIWGSEFKNEVTDKLHHFRGALSMANAGPDTNSSQFFIVQAPTASGTSRLDQDVAKKYNEIGGVPSLDMSYSIFGQAFEGMDVVDKIAAVPTTTTATGQKDKPVNDVKIISITITTY